MSERQLREWEKELIIDHIQSGIAAGESKSQLSRRRREVRELLGDDVTISQVNAISAWIKIRAKRNAEMQNPTGTTPMTTESSSVTSEVKAEQPEGCEHFDYNNEVKNRWRMKWQEYIAQHSTPEERASMKVLCFPGKLCLEIPIYLELGFHPENIMGVEGGDQSARQTFTENADRYGIGKFTGRMEDFLETDTTHYDVVSLDFPGQFSGSAFKIARKILLKRKALVLTNFMAKRERPDVQESFQDMIQKLKLRDEDFAKFGVDTLAQSELEPDEAGTPLREARSMGVLNFHSNFGFLRKENRVHSKHVDNFPLPLDADIKKTGLYTVEEYTQLYKRQLINACIQASLKPTEALFSQSGISIKDARVSTFMVYALCLRGFYGTPFTTDIKSYRYISKSDKGNSPFESDFAVVKTPVREYTDSRHLLEFAIKAAAAIMEAKIKEAVFPHLSLRNKNRGVKQQGEPIINSDFLVWDTFDNKLITEIKVGRFFGDLAKYETTYQDAVTERIDKNNLVLPRETIE